jgi:hypothetical protein
MLKLGSIRFHTQCPRRPRYSPARDGLAGIKGGCPKCRLLLDIFESHQNLVSLMRRAIPVRDSSGVKPQRDSTSQLPLF